MRRQGPWKGWAERYLRSLACWLCSHPLWFPMSWLSTPRKYMPLTLQCRKEQLSALRYRRRPPGSFGMEETGRATILCSTIPSGLFDCILVRKSMRSYPTPLLSLTRSMRDPSFSTSLRSLVVLVPCLKLLAPLVQLLPQCSISLGRGSMTSRMCVCWSGSSSCWKKRGYLGSCWPRHVQVSHQQLILLCEATNNPVALTVLIRRCFWETTWLLSPSSSCGSSKGSCSLGSWSNPDYPRWPGLVVGGGWCSWAALKLWLRSVSLTPLTERSSGFYVQELMLLRLTPVAREDMFTFL